ncbi:hypothetical protein AAHA92_22673 [Salvia divinorum]|uniref:Myb/SANT-like domain-containing protein n=1 Tax=Salvia divinorum TaxID=28513 RepID=A0ABD1GPX2_SALDI
MDIPLQEAYFYSGKWNHEMDTILVDTIMRMKGEMQWVLKVFPCYFHMIAADQIQEKTAVVLTEDDISDRLEVLHCRFRTFKNMVRETGVVWDLPSERVIAADYVWEKIFAKTTFARAYYYKHEPLYSKLACLYGLDEVKIEQEKEVIVISDTNDDVHYEEHSCYEVGGGKEEVNSPHVAAPRTARCKLFVESDEQADRESTTEPGIYFIDLAPDGQLCTRIEKSRVLTKNPFVKQDQGGPSNRSPYASSCGSNSPLGWWRHLHN